MNYATITFFAALAVTHTAAAQNNYPARPIRLIVPFPPGGNIDITARAIAPGLGELLGQTIVVDNRPGAAGQLGLELGARAAPDGYTLVGGQGGNLVVQPHTYKKLPYDPFKDFAPVALSTRNYLALVVSPNAPFKSVKEMIAYARSNPGKLTFASNGDGGFPHMSMEMLRVQAGFFDYLHIPYKGSGPSIIDLVGGQVALSFGSTSVLPHVQTKKLILLGVSGAQRSSFVPDTPTIAESGVPGYEVTAWNALFAPATTPAPIISKLNQLVRQGLAHPDSKAVMEAQGLDVTPSTPQELGELIRSELAKWSKVIKAAGIKPE